LIPVRRHIFAALHRKFFWAEVTAAAGVTITAPTGDEVASAHCNPAGREPPDKVMEQVSVEPARTLFEQDRLSVADCAQSGRLKSADRSNFFMLSP
jgi:hypothetical protein